MKLKFSLDYNTTWGENLHVLIVYTAHDGKTRTDDLPMQTEDGCHWQLETAVIDSRQHPIASFTYIYKVEDSNGQVVRSEWDGVPRTFAFDASKDYLFPDVWRDYPLQHHLYTKACLVTRNMSCDDDIRPVAVPLFRRTCIFRVSAPQLHPGQTLGVCGSHPALGGWNTSRYLPLQYAGRQEWILSVSIDGLLTTPLEYKYVVIDKSTGTVVCWEEGDNRTTADHTVADGEVLVLDGGVLRICEDLWKIAGVSVPVFSLRSASSYGVGDFGDLRRMVDWAAQTGMKMIQILPVCDTTICRDWIDSSPYHAVSLYALHPHYVDLEAAGILADADRMTSFHRQRRELNASEGSDYMAVDRVKGAYLRELFAEQGAAVCASSSYQDFLRNHISWLLPYAVFCLLRDTYHTAHYADWGDYARYDEKAVADYAAAHSVEVDYIYFVQYLLHTQLLQAADYARRRGVSLMCDMSIGVCHDSVDTWIHPELFHLDRQAGTPPDAASPYGQNWGVPTDRIEAKKAQHPRWWRNRQMRIQQYFDAVRLDHVLGYFRMWEIPATAVYAQLGHFAPALPLGVDEIERFGLHFRPELFTCPFVNDRLLQRLFGIHAPYVREHYLDAKGYGLYGMKPEFDTQQKVRLRFEGKRDENSLWIRDGLYRLIANVLFIEDEDQPNTYHPRVNAFHESVFEVLDSEEKDAYLRLYNHYFYQRHNGMWGRRGKSCLPEVLAGCKMLVCAEDLGMLPDCVEPVLDRLRILTTEIQTLPKQDSFEFAHLGANPYRSLATTSTHDMAPLRLWWTDNHEQARRYHALMLQKEGATPEKLTPLLAEEIIARHLYSPSMLCVLPFQDWMAMATQPDYQLRRVRGERINVPGDTYNHWQYRMPVTIEKLLQDTAFSRKIKTMITRSRR